MWHERRWLRSKAVSLVLLVFLAVLPSATFAQGSSQGTQKSPADVGATRQDLIELLRLSPKLAAIVVHDPSLLGEQQYIARNNPKLAEFLQSHPDVGKNPEFYLFANVPPTPGSPEVRLETEMWPQLRSSNDGWIDFIRDAIGPMVIFLLVTGALFWLIRTALDHRRWSRTFKVQTDIYNKLFDKFANNEELIAYVQSESGKRFLESATLPQVPESRGNSAVSRVLIPLQIGVVGTLAGLAFLYLHRSIADSTPLLGLGVLVLALGLGFIISAGIAWFLAERLGILHPVAETTRTGVSHSGPEL